MEVMLRLCFYFYLFYKLYFGHFLCVCIEFEGGNKNLLLTVFLFDHIVRTCNLYILFFSLRLDVNEM